MIDARELRRGVFINTPFGIGVVDDISKRSVIVVRRNARRRYITYEEMIPLKLTPEILLKVGFEKCLDDNDYQILMGKGTPSDGLFLIIDATTYVASIGQLYHFSHGFGEYKYLHQLMNLYYSLVGKELEITL